ncbi:Down syndrome cell adhesion molecule-like protein Dscam2 [Araneus ventricosus]|uniref:Down syndrome cell adhesion molecule-like protein Dscam2 n=1 Tax=Araneus ventricosus TaxID=182803 RepID=A0A4Y2K7B5_ARAVE|nr:Down syndrome cell adhesion molecule-like protein Dscam2 [Araneus ventricosus]
MFSTFTRAEIPLLYLTFSEDPPEFREVFPERLLRPGAKTSLRCLVTGNPLPQVSWRLYSRPVVEGLGVRIGDFVDSQGLLMSFINISAVTSEHGGIYSCHARNEIGAISHSARLSVYGPPYIHPMDNITAVTGDEVNVDCAVSGHPLRSIRWRKGRNIINHLILHMFKDREISWRIMRQTKISEHKYFLRKKSM